MSKPKKPKLPPLPPAMLLICRAAGLPDPLPEHRFALPRRQWRFDLAWPAYLVAVEREGGVWTGGRHTHPSGFLDDIEKYNEAAIMGWLLVRHTPDMERSGEALRLIERALEARGWRKPG